MITCEDGARQPPEGSAAGNGRHGAQEQSSGPAPQAALQDVCGPWTLSPSGSSSSTPGRSMLRPPWLVAIPAARHRWLADSQRMGRAALSITLASRPPMHRLVLSLRMTGIPWAKICQRLMCPCLRQCAHCKDLGSTSPCNAVSHCDGVGVGRPGCVPQSNQWQATHTLAVHFSNSAGRLDTFMS